MASKQSAFAFIIVLASVVAAHTVLGQDTSMSFFITSEGPGNGANLGGLAGADAHCQMLASGAGAGGSNWRAYLSTSESGGQAAVNARDRIGSGPWQNANGQVVAQDVGHLHGDTLEQARRGSNLVKSTALNENGEVVNGRGDSPNRHDILTGSQLDGTAFPAGDDHTCGNWTNSGDGSGQVGHHDRSGGGNTSWNSAHGSRGCSQEQVQSSGGDGLIYCFAID